MFGDINQCDPIEKGSQIHYDYFKSVLLYGMCPKRIEITYIEEHARYDPQMRDMFTKFLRTGNVNNQFEPRVRSYHNICYLNKTPEGVNAGCAGVSKNYRYVEWRIESSVVYQQKMCAGETEMFC